MSSPAPAVAAPTPCVLIGAGQRGIVYTNYALDHPELLCVVGVAEPNAQRRQAMAAKFNLSADVQFDSWEAMLAARQAADPAAKAGSAIAVIATPDALHHGPAVAFARAGYHILLEKPMAVQPRECKEIADAAQQSGALFAVCHVLRYTPVNRKIRDLIADGSIGQLLSIQHLEPVGATHFAHSYVRGNWHSEAKSTFSLMAKSCHDIDLLSYWMDAARPLPPLPAAASSEANGSAAGVAAVSSAAPATNPVVSVSSFGSLLHFTPRNKPATATSRCMTCPAAVERACTYSAKRIYLDPLTSPGSIPSSAWTPNYLALVDAAVPDIENITAALASGPYGTCVYSGANDVVDNQVVNLQYAQGQTASFSMVATTSLICRRQTRVFGSDGEIECDGHAVTLRRFREGSTDRFEPLEESGAAVGRLKGHSGADYFLVRSFVEAVRGRAQAAAAGADGSSALSAITTGPEQSLISHQIVFAAEEARRHNRVVHMHEWIDAQNNK